MAVLMRDHPGWTATPNGAQRVMRQDTTVWHLCWEADDNTLNTQPAALAESTPNKPLVDRFVAPPLDGPMSGLTLALTDLGPVLRARNTDLWDAIGNAIIRQVIRAGQARQMYARFCAAHGQLVETPSGDVHLFPSPDTVLNLPAQAFDDLRMGFKRPALTAAASAVIEHGPTWAQLPPHDLVDTLQRVPRIGPWTAGAAVADYTGDFGCYPFADLAVRTWARRAAPDFDWPDQEPAFGALWRDAAGADLSALTLLTLAWGDAHVRAP